LKAGPFGCPFDTSTKLSAGSFDYPFDPSATHLGHKLRAGFYSLRATANSGQVFSLGMTSYQITPATPPFDFAQGRLYAGTSKEMRGQAAAGFSIDSVGAVSSILIISMIANSAETIVQ